MAGNILASWSGGKDSCYAVMLALQDGNTLKAVLNMMNENGAISRSHAIPLGILQQQAASLGVPLMAVPSTWADYERNFIHTLTGLKEQYGLNAVAFGDIDLQPHRDWEEKVCAATGLKALLPLWQRPRRPLVLEMISVGIKATIVSCNTQMGIGFLGRTIDVALVAELEAMGVDSCGENGEYHTLVADCPLFKNPLSVLFGDRRIYNEYCFIEMK